MDDAAVRARALFGKKPTADGPAATESSNARTGPPDQRDVTAIARQLQSVGVVGGVPGVADRAQHMERLATALVEQAQAAVDALESGASAGSLSDAQMVALESVIRTRGRPALKVEDGGLEALDETRHPGSGFWRIPVADNEGQLLRVAASTGAVMARVLAGGAPIVCGTAWLIAPNLLMTNRHVLFPPAGTALAKRNPQRVTEADLTPGIELFIDFAHEEGTARDGKAAITAVPFVAEDADPVDVAILRIAAPPAGASTLRLVTSADVSRQLFLVGHPGVLAAVPADVQAVFGTPNGRKRVCFGEKLAATAALPGVMGHDASSIGGFSGACVLAFGSAGVSALHYYGDPARGNRAITADALRAHPVAAFL
jgi:hypothetical protein